MVSNAPATRKSEKNRAGNPPPMGAQKWPENSEKLASAQAGSGWLFLLFFKLHCSELFPAQMVPGPK